MRGDGDNVLAVERHGLRHSGVIDKGEGVARGYKHFGFAKHEANLRFDDMRVYRRGRRDWGRGCVRVDGQRQEAEGNDHQHSSQ